eukprot:CAMPEP_0116870896 /NCGR_PEP_ID=MMETSP0463-20121206/1012_1 /TAXON_ID=181622 /ORGANISM="Strombidinopsis sp, Strain SopsisLIS2011" /LENGTH=49 /DNA_ID=CAMNT_0004508307 /DNA_START=1310 /DNA_END=1459 /DNA_ORIENTATION=+
MDIAREPTLMAGVITDILQSATEGDIEHFENLDAEVIPLLLLIISSLPN